MDFRRRIGSVGVSPHARYGVFTNAGFKLADCVVSESEKNPKRVYCTVAFGEGTREPLKIPVKSCNRAWTSYFASSPI